MVRVNLNLRSRLALLRARHFSLRTAELSTHQRVKLSTFLFFAAKFLLLYFLQFTILGIVLVFAVEIYGIIPALLWLSPWLRNTIVFMTWAGPKRRKRGKPLLPKEEGVVSQARHRFLATPEGHRLGLWEVLADQHPSLEGESEEAWRAVWEDAANPQKPVFLLLHGQGRHRGGKTRAGQCNMLTSLGFNTISFDYRGFGDSSGRPTPEGVVNDTIYVYLHLKGLAHPHPIILYGHSLGSGIAARAADRLKEMGEPVSGLVLDAAFSSLTAALRTHVLFAPYRIHRLVAEMATAAFDRGDQGFPSHAHIARLDCPILLLHAKDDHIVPFTLAESLKEAAEEVGGRVELVLFDSELRLGHNAVHTAPQVPAIVRNYLARAGWEGEILIPLSDNEDDSPLHEKDSG